jgi:hypothetical protein
MQTPKAVACIHQKPDVDAQNQQRQGQQFVLTGFSHSQIG